MAKGTAMIIARIYGGLGNQMFQYAVGRAISLRCRSDLKLDIAWYENIPGSTTKREYQLNIFKIKENFASRNDILRLKLWRGSFVEKVIANRLPKLHKLSILIPSKYHLESANGSFSPEVLKISGNAYLEGNWQSQRYFMDYSDVIRRDFKFKQSPLGENKKMLEKISKVNSVSIHIRRSDYVTNKNHASYYTACGLDYYETAIKLMTDKMTGLKAFVFSDDLKWARENLKIKLPVTYVDINSINNSYWDMLLMSNCKHNIIANSSFSWWGAWLNSNENKQVIAPRQWFNDPSINVKDRIPPEWITI